MEFYLDLFWHFKFERVLMPFSFKFLGHRSDAVRAYKRTSTEQQIEVSDILYCSKMTKKAQKRWRRRRWFFRGEKWPWCKPGSRTLQKSSDKYQSQFCCELESLQMCIFCC